jgi:hypothetical protein
MRTMIRLLAVLACAAAAAAAPNALVAGPDVRLGDAVLAPWPGYGAQAAAFAGNGDETVMVFGASAGTQGNLYGVRFDRHGRVLTPVPVLLSPGGWTPDGVRVLWTGAEYVVVFRRNGFFGLRMTSGLQVLAEQRLPWQISDPISVATDGREIVAVGSYGRGLERMGLDLSPRGPLQVEGNQGKAVAHGPDGIAIVALGGGEKAPVTLQFLRDGVLSTPVTIAVGNNTWDGGGSVSAVWTGTHYAAAWSECVHGSCLAQWKLFGADGAPASPAHPLAYGAVRPGITAIDAETVLVTWRELEKSFGQRWRGTAPLDPGPVAIGVAGGGAGMTPQGALIVADGAMRIALVPNAVSALLPDPLPLGDVLLAPSQEYFADAAATDSEVAILRWRLGSYPHVQRSLVVSILPRDGKPAREAALAGTAGAIASDGRDFYAVTVDGGTVWFQKLGGQRTPIGLGIYVQPVLEWNGEAFVVAWHEHPRLRVLRIGRAGDFQGARILQWPDLFGKPSLFAAPGGETLLAWSGRVVRLDAALNVVDEESIAGAAGIVCAVNGDTEACLWRADSPFHLPIGFRRRGGAFTAVRDVARITDGSQPYPAALVPMGEGYLALWRTGITGRQTTTATLLDASGGVVDEERLHDADAYDFLETRSLLPLTSTRALLIHTRSEQAAPFAGMARVFARTLSAPRRRGISAF